MLSRIEPALKTLTGVVPVLVMEAFTAELPTLSIVTAKGLSRFSSLSIETARAEATKHRIALNFMMTITGEMLLDLAGLALRIQGVKSEAIQ